MAGLRWGRTVLAGLAATWVMDRVDKLVYLAQPAWVHRREAELEDLTGPGQLARVLMRAAGHEPTHDEAVAGGRFLHLTMGACCAIAYVAGLREIPSLRAGFGAGYGLAILPANLVVVPALGLTPPATAFPRETTIRGAIYHIGYGVALEACVRLLRLDAPRG